jgi:F1F0 ATPase subunit 2
MNETLTLLPAFVAGTLLGAFFFGGLWWTVRKGLASKKPALWFIGSLLLRTGIALASFYYFARGNWVTLLACLLGFILARPAVTRLTEAVDKPNCPVPKVSHET